MIQRHNKINANYRHKEIDQIKTATSKHENKHYKFSYAVKDRQSGDDFSHTQKQENGAVHGSYKTVLPDKRVQIVKYTADDIHGYRAEVSYENSAKEQDHRWSVEQNHRFTSVTPYGINHRSPQIISFLPSTSSSSRHY